MTTWTEIHYPDSSIDDWEMATISTADYYHELRGNTDWVDGDDDDKETALYRAWDYLRGLDWLDDVFDTELPADIASAHIVAAYAEFNDPGCLQPVLSKDDYIQSKNIGGAIIKSYKMSAPSKKRFLELESLLRRYVRNSGATVELRRG